MTCDMRYDTSETRLVAVDQVPSGRGDITTDLEGGEPFPLHREQVVAASTSGGDVFDRMSDVAVVAAYSGVLHERYVTAMPQCCDAEASEWIRWIDDSQLATICRAVARVEDAMASYAVRTGQCTSGTEVLWTPNTRAILSAAYSNLRRVVLDVQYDMAAVLASMVDSE